MSPQCNNGMFEELQILFDGFNLIEYKWDFENQKKSKMENRRYNTKV